MPSDRYVEAGYRFRANRPNRPHLVVWTEPNTGRRCSRAFPTKRLALDYRRRKQHDLDANLTGMPDTPWHELLLRYAQIQAGRRSSPSHLGAISHTLEAFGDSCETTKLADATTQRVENYLAELAAGNVPNCSSSAWELRKQYRILRAFFQCWVLRGLIASNPLDPITPPRTPHVIPDAPTDAEWVSLLEVLEDGDLQLADPQAWHLYILLAVVTGIDQRQLLRTTLQRRSSDPSVVTYTLGDADTGGIGLMRAWRRKTRHSQPPRLHGLPAEVCNRLAVRESHLLELGRVWLFPWLSFQRKAWQSICRKAHFDHRFKSLRAACATRVAEAGALRLSADALGHASSRTTARHYAEQTRIAVAAARQLQLPALPPLPEFGTPQQRRQRVRGRPGRRPAESE